MSYSPYECPISKQISQVEEVIVNLSNRIRGLEDLLDNPNLEEEQRNNIEDQLNDIKDILNENRIALKGLHKKNTKSFIVAGCLIFLCFFIYGVYTIIYNPY